MTNNKFQVQRIIVTFIDYVNSSWSQSAHER